MSHVCGTRAVAGSARVLASPERVGGRALPFASARRGFTFVELLTVVAIISILAAILFPVFARARDKARQLDCMTHLKQIGLALSLYARDYAGHFPPQQDDVTPLLGRWLPDPEPLVCPSAGAERKVGAAGPPRDYFYRAGFCDDDDPATALMADSELGRHNEGANGLFADGHGKWCKNPQTDRSRSINPLRVFMEERGLKPVPEPPPSAPPGMSKQSGGGRI